MIRLVPLSAQDESMKLNGDVPDTEQPVISCSIPVPHAEGTSAVTSESE